MDSTQYFPRTYQIYGADNSTSMVTFESVEELLASLAANPTLAHHIVNA
jgi:hypothetical protein